jgi:SAM-dependent methyltransferase
MQFAQYWPHEHTADSFSQPVSPDRSTTHPSSPLPVPPREFWANYCTSAESFLSSGREDVETMCQLLEDSGAPVEEMGRILELGCAGGRMLRWLTHLAPDTQLWGTDIWSSAILWCQDHLSPPCHFATTTMVPHLPFEDRSFGLVYCGSVFTHIDDLADAWFLELHRILRPGGRLYFSINDRHAVHVFDGEANSDAYPRYYERTGGQDNWDAFVAMLAEHPGYQRFRRGDAYMVTMGRSMSAHVMWDTDVLCRRLEYGYKVRAITPESYGHQTTVFLERT